MNTGNSHRHRHVLFVTGRLAEPALRRVVEPLAESQGFDYSIQVMPITVAALMTPEWIAPRLNPSPDVTEIWLPGYCDGNVDSIDVDAPVHIGPRDLADLPEHFGEAPRRETGRPEGYGTYEIEILAEINHAPRLGVEAVLREARRLAADGADVIDIGCEPGRPWSEVAECVGRLRDAGLRVSIDSFDRQEVAAAVQAGAELVLSVNSSNRDAAADWGCEVVVIPDQNATLVGLDATIERMEQRGVSYRIDPILEPIGFGFAESLHRYHLVRDRYPHAAMMMGIGNITELTDADSAAINVLLLGICQELGVRSVLTTQVINWARTSVKECDLGRRLVHYAVQQRTLPKHVEPDLILLRDPKVRPIDEQLLDGLASRIRDANYRLFADVDRQQLHLISRQLHIRTGDPFELIRLLVAEQPKNLTAEHAFYLGYEACKAVTAITLGKQYTQDEALRWGFLTRPEPSGRPLQQSPEQEESS